MKTCSKCGEAKPLTEFWGDKHAKDGKWSKCKTCGKAANKAAHDANKEKMSAKNKAWRDANKQRIRERKIRKRAERLQWCVYALRFPDGGYYFGSTSDFEYRTRVHTSWLTTGTHRNPNFRARGYTKDDVSAEVLETFPSDAEAKAYEAELIWTYFEEPDCLNAQLVRTSSFSIPRF